MSETVIQASGLVKTYREGAGRSLCILDRVDMTLSRGDVTAVVGASGSGKSTLLNLLGGLDRPDEGTVTVGGEDIYAMGEQARGRLRNQQLGFVYQFHHLLPEFTALENVAMPLLIGEEKASEARRRAQQVLERTGLADRLSHKPSALSGGERQRVAIARALVTNPRVVLADEPTGNLDERTADQVQALMMELNEELGTAFLVVTHDTDFSRRCKRRLTLHDGRLEEL
jgi:lipoprotein-releasing system ATP-binding protein